MHFTDAIRSTTTKRLSKYARCVITILFKHNHLHNKLVIIHLTPALNLTRDRFSLAHHEQISQCFTLFKLLI